MPKGEHLIGGYISKPTQFSADRQPDKYRQPDSITALIKQELAGDGWAVLQDAEILNEEGKPTGQKATVRVKLTTADAVAKKILQRAMKGSDKLMTELWERIDGKVPQNLNLNGGINVNMEATTLTPETIDAFNRFLEAKQQSDNGSSPLPGKQTKR